MHVNNSYFKTMQYLVYGRQVNT